MVSGRRAFKPSDCRKSDAFGKSVLQRHESRWRTGQGDGLMLRIAMSAAAFAAAMGSAATALAGSWDVGVGAGFGWYPQPVPPPGYYHHQPLVIIGRAPPPAAAGAVSPDDVFDALERAGYREFSPMADRGGVYELRAVNPAGDLVALEVSAHTGEIERELILAERLRNAPAAIVAPSSPRAPLSPPQPSQPAEEERDPLVVY
jgi:hypothetical protein